MLVPTSGLVEELRYVKDAGEIAALTRAAAIADQALARVLARQLGRVGISVQVRSYEWGVFFADLKKGNFQLATPTLTRTISDVWR